MMKFARSWALISLCSSLAALGGCASGLVGYEAETSHTCPRVEGLGCTPVSEVYKRAMAGTLPGQATELLATGAMHPAGDLNLASAAIRPVMTTGMPVRTAPRVLRIWFAPWRDALDVLHDQRHSYLTLDNGRWLIEHNQQRLFQEFGATRLVQGQGSSAEKPTAPAAPARSASPIPTLPPTAPGLPGAR